MCYYYDDDDNSINRRGYKYKIQTILKVKLSYQADTEQITLLWYKGDEVKYCMRIFIFLTLGHVILLRTIIRKLHQGIVLHTTVLLIVAK